VSDPVLDVLAESARNRGLKLVRSRVRTPGKPGFGTAGLTDGSGRPVFGMDATGPIATPDEIEAHLRSIDAGDWGASLDGAKPPPKRTPTKAAPRAANDRQPKRRRPHEPKPPPAPKLELREAKPTDAAQLVALIHELGHQIDEASVRKNLTALKTLGELPRVVTLDKRLVAMCGVSKRVVVHRPAPLGRITALIVTKKAQGHGIGRMLVEAAEDWMRKAGCQIVEVTSNDRRAEAHAFYRHMGYERTSIRFAKTLQVRPTT
jgi:GNAT superfamily N-acetyltransferase